MRQIRAVSELLQEVLGDSKVPTLKLPIGLYWSLHQFGPITADIQALRVPDVLRLLLRLVLVALKLIS